MRNDISINQNDFTKNVEGFEDIKQCWKNILFTIPGSVPMMPTFGCDIWQYIDKPTSDSFGKARNVIIAALEKWETRAKITKVTRTIEGSNVLIDIFGIHTVTGDEITTQISTAPAEPELPPDPPVFAPVEYGALYNPYAITDSRNIANTGWRFPSFYNDILDFLNYITSNNISDHEAIGTKLSIVNLVNWIFNTGALDTYGFSLKGAGCRGVDGIFEGLNTRTRIFFLHNWYPNSLAYMEVLDGNGSGAMQSSNLIGNPMNEGVSVRLLRDATTEELSLPDGPISATYTGNNLRIYPLTKIGNKIWLACNLDETKFNNGEWIPGYDGGTYTPISNENWVSRSDLGESLMCYYGDDETKG